jgi:hypothetical protein
VLGDIDNELMDEINRRLQVALGLEEIAGF